MPCIYRCDKCGKEDLSEDVFHLLDLDEGTYDPVYLCAHCFKEFLDFIGNPNLSEDVANFLGGK